MSTEATRLAEALTIGREAAYEVAQTYHAAMAGYRQYEHDRLDADVKKIDDAIVALATSEAQAPADGVRDEMVEFLRELIKHSDAIHADGVPRNPKAEEHYRRATELVDAAMATPKEPT